MIKTEELIADFTRKLLIGPKKIFVETEFGSLVSGAMEYSYRSDTDEEIYLTNGVRVEVQVD